MSFFQPGAWKMQQFKIAIFQLQDTTQKALDGSRLAPRIGQCLLPRDGTWSFEDRIGDRQFQLPLLIYQFKDDALAFIGSREAGWLRQLSFFALKTVKSHKFKINIKWGFFLKNRHCTFSKIRSPIRWQFLKTVRQCKKIVCFKKFDGSCRFILFFLKVRLIKRRQCA